MTQAHLGLITRFAAALGQPGEEARFEGLLDPDVEFDIPGSSPLAGRRYGLTQSLAYLSDLAAATQGTHGLDRVIDCLSSPTGGGLLVRESFCRRGVSFSWTRLIYLEIRDNRIRRATWFESDQRGLDEMLSLPGT